MILDKQDSIYAATKLMEYFKDFGRIDDYFRARKIERVKDIPAGLPGMSIEDDLFQDYDMHPEDMNFQVVEIPNKVYDTLLEKTASFSPDENPGKTLKLVVKETTTNTIVGFIRYGSPLIILNLVMIFLVEFLIWISSTNVLSWGFTLWRHNHLGITVWVVSYLLQSVVLMQLVEC